MLVKIRMIRFLFALLVACLCRAGTAMPLPEIVEFDSLEEGRPTRLKGLLFKPAPSALKAPAPGLVLAHGCSGMYDAAGNLSRGIRFWSEQFARGGFVVLAVDSFNPRGHREICTHQDRPILESRERPVDAYGALRYLAAQAFVQKERVFLMGFSNGATGTLYAVDPTGKAYQRARDSGISFRAAIALYPGCTGAERRGFIPAIPTLILIGALDDWTPPKPCEKLIENARAGGVDAMIHLYPDAYHGFDVPGSKVRVRTDVRMRNSPNLERGVHVGGNDAAREAAVRDVDAFLRRNLK